jgi:hypothetical protein
MGKHLHAIDFKVVQSGQRVGRIADVLKMDDSVFAADTEGVDGHVAAFHLLWLHKNDFVDGTNVRKYLLREIDEIVSAQAHFRTFESSDRAGKRTKTLASE